VEFLTAWPQRFGLLQRGSEPAVKPRGFSWLLEAVFQQAGGQGLI